MASISQGAAVRPVSRATGRGGRVDKYFYFTMSLLLTAIVIWGFSHTVDHNLIHATPARPLLLWIHGAAFSAWMVFYIFQSALVRTRNVKWHRSLGWFGVGLAALMVPLGFIIAVLMARFDVHILKQTGIETFLAIPFFDMIAFGLLAGLAIYWRRQPELHRRLLFIATCGLMDAAFGRNDYIFSHNLYFICLDGVILLGVMRDLLVDRRIHEVYRLVLPPLWIAQAITAYLYAGSPAWWLRITRSIIG
jgi:hypothetical protein